jgi:hypothetical protein
VVVVQICRLNAYGHANKLLKDKDDGHDNDVRCDDVRCDDDIDDDDA